MVDLSELDAKKLATVVSVTRRFKLRNENHKPVVPEDDLALRDVVRHLKQQVKILTPDEITHIKRDYAKGMIVYELGTKYDVHRSTISAALHRNDVRMRRLGLTPAQTIHAQSLYESGLSLADIGSQLHRSPGTIRNHLLKAGVRLRPRPGR